MMSPASTSTMSPTLRLVPGTELVVLAVAGRSSSLACVSVRVLAQRVGLRLAASLGHRLGEVREQHREPEPEDDLEREAEVPPPVTRSRMKMTVVSAATTSTTNMTGFLISTRGSSLAKADADGRHDDLRIEQGRDRHALVAASEDFH